jgi:hypothetical protein
MKGICFLFRAPNHLDKGKGKTTMTNSRERATWADLLYSAVHTPGKLLAAYTAFHNFSFGNALPALEQCLDRNIEPGPLNNYKGWQMLKRQVRQGEKGLSLCMPVTYKKRTTDVGGTDGSEEGEETLGDASYSATIGPF